MNPMLNDQSPRVYDSGSLPETIRRLYRKEAFIALQKVLSKLFPSDVARILDSFSQDDAQKIFLLIPSRPIAARALKQMSPSLRLYILREVEPEQLIPILEELNPDDRADIIGQLEPELARRFMGGLDEESLREVEDLLKYDVDTAGGIMTSELFALSVDTTVEGAIEAVRRHPHSEMVYYLYVVDDSRRLVGVSSLRQLILADPLSNLAQIMNTRVLKAQTDDPRSEVAEMIKRHRLLGVPVVDDMGVLMGMVTVDDIITTLEEEASGDVLRLTGASSAEVASQSFLGAFRVRLPWLIAALLGGVAASGIIDLFEGLIVKDVALSAFIPIVMNLAGNVGAITASVTVHGLSTGVIRLNQFPGLLLKESVTGLALGAVYGLIGGMVAWFLFADETLGHVVGLTILFNMTLAAILSLSLPFLLEKYKGNPAVVSGPFLTTALDLLGVGAYLVIAQQLLWGG
ncbi:MAG: magnesium transporter [Magnetococcales bacterium]|nr:magnesium transporter [Magnetococcales bacterium]